MPAMLLLAPAYLKRAGEMGSGEMGSEWIFRRTSSDAFD
jgi:hypothetical protein